MSRRSRVFAAVLLLFAAYGYGVLSHDNRWPPTPQVERAIRRSLWHLRPQRGFADTRGRQEMPCRSIPGESAVWLTLGQSNAANEGDLDYTTGSEVYNFNIFDGRCYEARDPLLGATGERGSVWTRVADRLIADGALSSVIIVPIAVGGTSIANWSPGGRHFDRIEHARRGLARVDRQVTHILWHQGETDVTLDPSAYTDHFTAMLEGMRAMGLDAPVYVAVASICKNHGSEDLRSAQRQLARRLAGVHPGPNTDTLDRFRWRRDMCHFSAEGLAEHARLWAEILETELPGHR